MFVINLFQCCIIGNGVFTEAPVFEISNQAQNAYTKHLLQLSGKQFTVSVSSPKCYSIRTENWQILDVSSYKTLYYLSIVAI
jgi:hypothetical protein